VCVDSQHERSKAVARYSVERAVWDEQDNVIGSTTVLETDDRDAAIQAADDDHAHDPGGQTVVYEDTAIIYEAKG
jgi:hypothetical protein